MLKIVANRDQQLSLFYCKKGLVGIFLTLSPPTGCFTRRAILSDSLFLFACKGTNIFLLVTTYKCNLFDFFLTKI